jgi:hypothetical protein
MEIVAQKTYWYLVGQWAWNLYRYGPSTFFWAGIDNEDMCARLSPGSQSRDWVNSTRCTELILRSYESFAVTVHTCIYVLAVYLLVKYIGMRVQYKMFAREMANEMSTHNKKCALEM